MLTGEGQVQSKKAQIKRNGVDHAVPCTVVRMYVIGMGCSPVAPAVHTHLLCRRG